MTRWAGVVALLLAAPVMAEPAAAPPSRAPPEYHVNFAPLSGAQPNGWSLYASIRGRSMDFGERDLGWADDPHVQRGEIEAGYGWRDESTTAVVGYIQHDGAGASYVGPRPPDDTPNSRRRGESGVIGMGFVLHAR